MAETKGLKFEDIARLPRPGSSAPSYISFSPDNKLLTFLHAEGDDLQRQLYSLDLSSLKQEIFVQPPGLDTEENLSLEEKLRQASATSGYWDTSLQLVRSSHAKQR